MAQTAIATQIHQPLDVHCDFTPLIALDLIFPVDQFTDTQHLVVPELVDPTVIRGCGA